MEQSADNFQAHSSEDQSQTFSKTTAENRDTNKVIK